MNGSKQINNSDSNHAPKRIGVFDSGHGGLDILRHLQRDHSHWDFFYVADMLFMPYGSKSLEQIEARCLEISSYFINEGVDAIIVACNTATAVAIDCLRDRFEGIPFIGIEPYLNYINKAPQKDFLSGKLGALVTPMTLESPRFQELKKRRDPENRVLVRHSEELATAIEELISNRQEDVFKKRLELILAPYRELGWEELILGCTHYPLVDKAIEDILKVKTISPAKSVIKQVYHILEVQPREGENLREEELFFSYLNTHDLRDGAELEWQRRCLKDFLFWS